MSSIPLVDLRAQHAALRGEIDAAVARVIDASSFILGPEVEGFEREFASYLGSRHAVGVSNGTDAIALALQALGIGSGDDVLVPAWTYIATASAVRMAGARPVFADVDPATFHLDPDEARARLTPATRAIVAVHLYGHAVDLGPLAALAKERGLALIEDTAQAHGARLPGTGRLAGSAGTAGSFSFYPSKNLGAMGDGGLVVTDDDAVAEQIRRLRNHGGTRRYEHGIFGYNQRLDGLQAAILRVKLPHLDGWNERRRAIAARYHEALADLPLSLPLAAPGRDHVYHVYALRCDCRDKLREHLERAGIGCVIHYPGAVHELPPFADLPRPAGGFPHAEAAAREVLSIPLYPEMTPEQVDRVIDAVRRFFAA